MHSLIVMSDHLELIRRSVKTQTRRIHKRPLRAGARAVLKRNLYADWTPETIVEITGVYDQRLGDMTERDARCEGFKSLKEFKDMWPRYSRRGWNDSLVVTVYEFRLVVT